MFVCYCPPLCVIALLLQRCLRRLIWHSSPLFRCARSDGGSAGKDSRRTCIRKAWTSFAPNARVARYWYATGMDRVRAVRQSLTKWDSLEVYFGDSLAMRSSFRPAGGAPGSLWRSPGIGGAGRGRGWWRTHRAASDRRPTGRAWAWPADRAFAVVSVGRVRRRAGSAGVGGGPLDGRWQRGAGFAAGRL